MLRWLVAEDALTLGAHTLRHRRSSAGNRDLTISRTPLTLCRVCRCVRERSHQTRKAQVLLEVQVLTGTAGAITRRARTAQPSCPVDTLAVGHRDRAVGSGCGQSRTALANARTDRVCTHWARSAVVVENTLLAERTAEKAVISSVNISGVTRTTRAAGGCCRVVVAGSTADAIVGVRIRVQRARYTCDLAVDIATGFAEAALRVAVVAEVARLALAAAGEAALGVLAGLTVTARPADLALVDVHARVVERSVADRAARETTALEYVVPWLALSTQAVVVVAVQSFDAVTRVAAGRVNAGVVDQIRTRSGVGALVEIYSGELKRTVSGRASGNSIDTLVHTN